MKNFLLLLLLLLTGLSAHASELTQEWIKIDSPFSVDWKNLKLNSHQVLGYSQLIDIEANPEDTREFGYFQKIDLQDTWKNRDEEDYHVLMIRTAYILDKPVSFFTAERVLDLDYVRELTPDWDIEQKSPQVFYTPGIFMKAPSCTFRIDFYSGADLERRADLRRIVDADPILGTPDAVVAQKSYDFGKIMFSRTAKSNSVVTRHYSISPHQTLIVSDAVNFVYNLPPEFAGGTKRMMDSLQKAADHVIAHLRAMKP